MSWEDAVKIVDTIPVIMQYFLPGFIFMKLLCHLFNKKTDEILLLTIWSATISYVIISALRLVESSLLSVCTPSLFIEVVISTFIGILFALIFFKLGKYINKIFMFITKQSIHTDIWREIIDCDYGTALRVYLKDSPFRYTGFQLYHTEEGDDSWFVLSNYICTNIETGSEFDSEDGGLPSTVAIQLKNIERIELVYTKETKVVK